MGLLSQSIMGTNALFMFQTFMKEHDRFGNSKSNLFGYGNRSRSADLRLGQPRLQTRRLSMEPVKLFHSVTELRIAVGWLRLFQTIVSPEYARAGRRPMLRKI